MKKNRFFIDFSKNSKFFSTCPRMILRPENESLDPPGTFWSPGCKAIGCIFRALEAREGRVGKRFSLIEASRRDSEGKN